MGIKKIFSKLFSKEALVIIDIIICPILAIVFSGPLFAVTPKFIFDIDIVDFFLIACFSIPISIIYFIVLLSLKKEKLLIILASILIGITGSFTIGIFIMSGLVMLLYALSQVFFGT